VPCTREDGVSSWEFSGGIRVHECPLKLVTQDSMAWMEWYGHYKNGLLPISGGLLDQSAVFTQAMDFIEHKRRSEQ